MENLFTFIKNFHSGCEERDMTLYKVMRHIEIDAAHRVPEHGGGCRNLHGHRYKIEAHCVGEVEGDEDDEQRGMVIDFKFIKEGLLKWVHNPCDHGLIMRYNDPLLKRLSPESFDEAQEAIGKHGATSLAIGAWWSVGLKLVILKDTPTAENLAKLWFNMLEDHVQEASEGRADLSKIVVWETPNCCAEYPFGMGKEDFDKQ
jgi:6-pyruvoyltetrahydropterin/6-carboxytetrahydropterin synthase